MADVEQILRDAEKRAALQFDTQAEGAGRRAAVSAVPRGKRRGQLQRAGAGRIASRHVPDSAAARAHDEVHAAHARVSRDACPAIISRSRSRWRTPRCRGSAASARSAASPRSARAGVCTPSGSRPSPTGTRTISRASSDSSTCELFRARRLVVDTGIHAKHWTRQQAIDYGIEASEVERYVVNPGQACSYMMGELKILELRDKAKKTLGDKFYIRDFHNAVLSAGTVPLDLLERRVDAYLREGDRRRIAAEGRERRARLSRAASPDAVRVRHDEDSRGAGAARRHVVVPHAHRAGSVHHAQPVAAAHAGAGAGDERRPRRAAGRGTRKRAARGRPARIAPGPAVPAIRATSTTSYYEEPITHRITNAGDRLFRFMVVTNASAGDEKGTQLGRRLPGQARAHEPLVPRVSADSRARADDGAASSHDRVRDRPGLGRERARGRPDDVGILGARPVGVVRRRQGPRDPEHRHRAARVIEVGASVADGVRR